MDIKLEDLSSPEFWGRISDSNSGQIPMTIVFPSGRAADATSGHLALVSDALYTHEAILEIEKLAKQGGLSGIKIKTLLDIDYYENISSARGSGKSVPAEDPLCSFNSNLLVLATADINVVTKILLHESNSIETYSVGYRKPYEDCIIVGGKGKIYAVMTYPNVGVLGLYLVPWCQHRRIAIFCGGILAAGTLAATNLLLRYLRGEVKGNNSHRKDVPVRIVSSSFREYHHVRLHPIESCMPPQELRNITDDIIIHE